MNLHFRGVRTEQGAYVELNGEPFDVVPSLKFRRHSPAGFEWGYLGSGPAQLSFAILLEALPYWAAELLYQRFKEDVVARLDRNEWTLTEAQVAGWISRNAEHMVRASYAIPIEPPVDVVEELPDDDVSAAGETEGPEGRSILRPGDGL